MTETELMVPYSPERIAVLDMASLDILDSLRLGDRVVGSASASLDYLKTYADNESIVNLGTIKEAVVEKNPDYIFVMDRDAAIGTEGAKLAQEIVENELVMGTDAYKNGNIVYLAHPAVWYTAEGGVNALNLMLEDLEAELLAE